VKYNGQSTCIKPMPLPATEYISQTNSSRRPLIAWLIVAGGALFFFSLIFIAPVATATHHDQLAAYIYGPFATLCHQLPERSFFVDGHKLAVCARCTGLYAGFTLATLLYPLARPLRLTSTPPPRWLFLAAVPMAVDVGLTLLGIWENTHTSRLLTGLLLGGVAVFYVMPGVADLSLRGAVQVAPTTRSGFTTASAEAIATAPSDYSAPHRRI
jgi:uncharacterized membrane protein